MLWICIVWLNVFVNICLSVATEHPWIVFTFLYFIAVIAVIEEEDTFAIKLSDASVSFILTRQRMLFLHARAATVCG